jgi:UDP-N-acetylmuramyl pentapeptide phosphotransferase/UDP-N-acetylglucosamine-1-phosphate transferase
MDNLTPTYKHLNHRSFIPKSILAVLVSIKEVVHPFGSSCISFFFFLSRFLLSSLFLYRSSECFKSEEKKRKPEKASLHHFFVLARPTQEKEEKRTKISFSLFSHG